MDHRAVEEANTINKLQHPVLKSVGGIISPEMQTPKLLWLRNHMPDTWHQAGMFMDLPDFLTWKATGSLTRYVSRQEGEEGERGKRAGTVRFG